MRRVILTGGEYLGGLAAVRALRAAGYDPWVAGSRSASYAGRSRSAGGVVPVPEPHKDAEGFSRGLADAASRLGAVAILPGTDGAHLALASHAELFPGRVALGTCALEIVERAVDKEWLRRATAPAGLKTPPTVSVTASDVERGAADLRLPAVVKPARSEMRVDHGRLRHFRVRRVESQCGARRRPAQAPAGTRARPALSRRTDLRCQRRLVGGRSGVRGAPDRGPSLASGLRRGLIRPDRSTRSGA